MPLDTLSLIAETLASLLSDSIKDRLKPKISADVAKTKVLELYKILSKINKETEYYIENFELYLSILASTEPQEASKVIKEQLKSSVVNIWEFIKELQDALDSINPQLEIHNHDLAMDITAFHMERMLIMQSQYAELRKLNYLLKPVKERKLSHKKVRINKSKVLEVDDVGELREILSKVKQNQKSINKITKNFREFIAVEFSFKESF